MKKMALLMFAVLMMVTTVIAQAKDSSHTSPDKKWKAVFSCKIDKKAVVKNGQSMHGVRCIAEIVDVAKGTKKEIANCEFDDSRYVDSLLVGVPGWSADSKYFVFIAATSHSTNHRLFIFETSSKSAKMIFQVKDNESFANSNDTEKPRVYIRKNSFIFYVIDDYNGIDDYKTMKTVYPAVRYEFSFSGKKISAKPTKVEIELEGS